MDRTDMATLRLPAENEALSSSPAFGTPLHPFLPGNAQRPRPAAPVFKPAISTILPILLPPPTLRPLAFRTFTKKHNLTLHSTALQALATFIGRHCGSGWREDGTGEKVLEEVAKIWKAGNGPVIVEDNDRLRMTLQTLQSCMSGGRIGPIKTGTNLSRQSSFAFGNDSAIDLSDSRTPPMLQHSGSSFGISSLTVGAQDEDDSEETNKDVRHWLKTVSAFDQPRFAYDVEKKHYLAAPSQPSMFPSPSHKSALFKERYHIIHQRLQRNPAFQAPSFSLGSNMPQRPKNAVTDQEFYKITPIANLLGRGGSSHLLLGMLVIAPTGTLALNDLSGSISLDLQHAASMQGGDVEPYFCPGMIVLVDGVYEEDWAGAGSSGLGNTGGVGGTIGGRFLGFQIGGPPVEKRDVSLGVNLDNGDLGGGFGWTDFLGVGSERAVGQRMKRLERRIIGPEADPLESRRKMVLLSEVTLDQPATLAALRKVLEEYAAAEQPPISFILTGNFSSKAAMAGAGTGSIEYKELFNELAAVLAEFPTLLRDCTFVFVPGDNDPWASSFSAGASTLIPKEGIPALFTSRVKRAFANAKSEGGPSKKDTKDGEAQWTSNPTRLSLFGPAHEILVFRDNISARCRRNAVLIGQASKEPPIPAPPHTQGDDIAMSGALPTTDDITADDAQTAEAMMLDPAPSAHATDSFGTVSAKRLILSLLPQSTLSPFPLNVRPTHWNFTTSALSLYPLPHTLVIADPDSPPFALTFEGCHVINPGRLVEATGRRKKVQWVEYDAWTKRGSLKESWVG